MSSDSNQNSQFNQMSDHLLLDPVCLPRREIEETPVSQEVCVVSVFLNNSSGQLAYISVVDRLAIAKPRTDTCKCQRIFIVLK